MIRKYLSDCANKSFSFISRLSELYMQHPLHMTMMMRREMNEMFYPTGLLQVERSNTLTYNAAATALNCKVKKVEFFSSFLFFVISPFRTHTQHDSRIKWIGDFRFSS